MNNDLTQERDYTSTPVRESDYRRDSDYVDNDETVTNGESSEAIRAEIERTRSQMSNKIDSIQNRLSPETIKAQAQDTLRSALEDGSNAVLNYWRENQHQIRYSVVDVVKRNPIPAALIGVGVGWALIDNLANRNKNQSASRYGWDDYQYGQAGGEQTYAQQYDTNYQTYGSGQYASGAQYSGVDQYTGSQGAYSGTTYQNPGSSERDWSSAQTPTQERSLGEKVSDAVAQVRDSASQVVDKATTKVGEFADQVQHQGQHYRQQLSEQTSQLNRQNTRQIVQSNPLTVGGIALGLGALIGLLLPSTERENEMMGELRNQVSDRAQGVVDDMKQRVQHAVDEVKPGVQNLANKLVDDLKSGEQTMQSGESDDLTGGTHSQTDMSGTAESNANRKSKKQRDRTAGLSPEDDKTEESQEPSRLESTAAR